MTAIQRATAIFEKGFALGQETTCPLRGKKLRDELWSANNHLVRWEIDQFVFAFEQGRRLRNQKAAAR
jgi:hypothetical protein